MSDLPYLNVQRTTFKISDFLHWARTDQLDLSPYYQRRSVWKRPAKSLLIDTVMRGLPVPIIIIRDRFNLRTQSSVREVVDGQQRLRTVLTFLGFEPSNPELDSEEGYEPDWAPFRVLRAHNSVVSKASTFRELSNELQLRFLNYEFAVHVLPSDTDDAAVLKMFTRLNSTGKALKGAELRNAEYHGPFATLVKDLAISNIQKWREWQVLSDSEISRMSELEFVADLCITVSKGELYSNTKGGIDSFYRAMENEDLEAWEYADEMTRRFDEVVDQLDRRMPKEVYGSRVTNRIIFSAVWVACYDHIFGLSSSLATKRKPKALPKKTNERFVELKKQFDDRDALPNDVADATQGAASDIKRRRIRFGFVKQVLEL